MDSDDASIHTASVYDRAADEFDEAPLALWARTGLRTVERLHLVPGKRVLDVCCGTGSTAIPAARAVGRFGAVVGIDLSERLLAKATAKAAVMGLTNIQFRRVDLNQLRFPKRSCDAVICQFGIFQLPDMVTATRLLWSMVAPGGALAITTWGPRVHEPVREAFWASVRRRRPDLHSDALSARRLTTTDDLRQLFVDAGTVEPEIEAETIVLPLRSADEFWMTMMGSGTRRVIEALGAEAGSVRQEVAEFVARDAVNEVVTMVLYATARRAEAPATRPVL